MRWLCILLFAVSAVPASASAANVTNFEGNYNVTISQKEGLDGPKCQSSFDAKPVHVEKGQIQTSGQNLISGNINDMGVLDGHLRRADGSDLAFEGNFEASEYDPTRIHILATIVDAKTSCGWTLTLVHE